MPNKNYVSLQDRFNKEEEYAKWGVPLKNKRPDKIDKIQEAIQEGWIQSEESEQQQETEQGPVVQGPVVQGVAAVNANVKRKLRKFFHEKSA